MNVLDRVMTFAEATEYLGKSNQYMYDLVKSGKLIEGKHYRAAGRVKLITKDIVDRIKTGGEIMSKMSLKSFEDLLETGNYSYKDNGMSGQFYGWHWYTVKDDETGEEKEVYVK